MMSLIPDILCLIAVFYSGALVVLSVQGMRASPVRAHVVASLRLAAARRDIGRLRYECDLAWATADRRLDLLREVAGELGTDVTNFRGSAAGLEYDETLALAARCKARDILIADAEVQS